MSRAKESAFGARFWKDMKGPAREEALKKGYDDNGGTFIKLAGQYVVARSDMWRPILFFVDVTLMASTVTAASYISILNGDVEAASDSFHFVIMFINMMIISANQLYFRRIIDDLFTAIGAGFFDYGDSIDSQTKKKMDKYIIDMRVTKKLRLRIFILIIWTLGASLIIKAIIFSIRYADKIDGEGGSVSKKHNVANWFPGLDKWPNYMVMVTSVYLGQLLIMNSILGFVLPVMCFAEELTGQLHIVGIGLRHTTDRAKYIFSCKYGEYRRGHLKSKYAECLREALRSSVQHHTVILEACNELKTLLNLPMMTVMVGTVVLLCTAGIVMVTDTVPIIAKTTSILFLGGEVIYAYLFCYYGQRITSTSEEIKNQLYYDDWSDGSEVIRPYMMMINLRCSRASTISAGGFSEINAASFANIINSSYSYFNLMFSSKS